MTLTSRRYKEEFYGKPVIVADREMIERESDEILKSAVDEDVSLLVVGDPLGCVYHILVE